MRQREVEVLAPAGSFESMKAAIEAGADAVYIGGSRFGARAYADNLDQERMLEAIDYAHIHGVSLYMTVNTLMKEEELAELFSYLNPYYERGLDAVIVQDLGAMAFIRKHFPLLPIHASTQMTITGVYGAELLARYGVKRVVTARELSLEEIRQIHDKVPVEIESFVHGALCYCYSGQCLLSSFIGGRSGNRGRCAQPCRLPYQVKGEKEKDRFLLSMKDLCTLDLIPDLAEAGVYSFKIEGRMKSPRYTAGVVRMYRKYTDWYLSHGRDGYHVNPEDKKELLELFDRGGFTEGYYRQHNGSDMIARKEKPAFRQGNQKLFDELDRLYVGKEKKEPVKGILTVKEGENIALKLRLAREAGKGRELAEIVVFGPEAEPARNQPMTKEQLVRQMKKTGDTPFEWESLDICLEGQVFLPVQAFNELRRRGLEELKSAVLKSFAREQGREEKECGEKPAKSPKDERSKDESRDRGEPELYVLIANPESLEAVLKTEQVARVMVEADGGKPKMWKDMVKRCHNQGKECVLAMPVIFRRQAKVWFDRIWPFFSGAGFDGILVRSLEEIGYLESKGVKIPVYGDHNLYAFNHESHKVLKELGCRSITFPLELNAREMKHLGGQGRELIGYGFLPAMVSAQCVTKTLSGCRKKPGRIMMKDRTGKELPVENHCTYCYNIIYNPSPLSLLDQVKQIKELGPKAVRLQFTGESAEVTGQITRAWAEELYGREDKERERKSGVSAGQGKSGSGKGDFTRGHFKRGVE